MADYAGVLAELRAKRDALDQERTELDEVIRGIERLIAKGGLTTPVTTSPLSRVAAAPGTVPTMPEAVRRFFKAQFVLEPQTTRQVVEGVRSQGIKGGKNLRGHVYNTLDRLSKDDGPYIHHSDGRWSLKSWNLGETTTNQSLLK